MSTRIHPCWIFRKKFSKIMLFIVLILISILCLLMIDNRHRPMVVDTSVPSTIQRFRSKDNPTFVVSITICGNQSFTQGMVALKSVLMFTKKPLHFIIMTDPNYMDNIEQKLHQMKKAQDNFSYELHQIQYPQTSDSQVWRMLFKECASQRLFLPSILDRFDSILYIDTDVLFLSPIEEIWSFFNQMNSTQMAAMAYESEDFSSNWYHRFARHPYYGPYGVNSGVMLMNLTRMRQFKWIEKLEPILHEYRTKIVWGDQDIINIIFNQYPDKLYLFECIWNYRPDHCVYNLTCKQAKSKGIKVLHGNRGSFITQKQPMFRTMFESFQNIDPIHQNKSDLKNVIRKMQEDSERVHSNCDKALELILKQPF